MQTRRPVDSLKKGLVEVRKTIELPAAGEPLRRTLATWREADDLTRPTVTVFGEKTRRERCLVVLGFTSAGKNVFASTRLVIYASAAKFETLSVAAGNGRTLEIRT
jgi:hypothetical protein